MCLLTYFHYHDIPVIGDLCLQYLVAVDAAPGRDVIEHSRIGAQGFNDVTRGHRSHLFLDTDHRQGAKQAAAVQLMPAHSSHSPGSSWGGRGATTKRWGSRPGSVNSSSTASLSRPWL